MKKFLRETMNTD
jgi:predicted RNase H-like nuclease (RuvC/YqgF family)